MNFVEKQSVVDDKWGSFLDYLELLLCNRCWRGTHGFGKPYHHHGAFLRLLSESNFTDENVSKWIKDTEHGLLHGVCTAFMCFCLCKTDELYDGVDYDESPYSIRRGVKRNPNWENRKMESERLILSCMVHDFVKCTSDYIKHDKELVSSFGNLVDSAYFHENPNYIDELVKSDRLELRRYVDYEKWCKQDVLREYEDDSMGNENILHFYHFFRPVVQRLYENLNDVWVSHALEYPQSGGDHYPQNNWIPIDEGYEPDEKGLSAFSIHYGHFEANCHRHTIKANSDGIRDIIGLIPLSKIKVFGKISHVPASCWGRDHLMFYRDRNIPFDQWLFAYKRMESLDHLDACVHAMSYDNIYKTFRLLRMIRDLFLTLSVD